MSAAIEHPALQKVVDLTIMLATQARERTAAVNAYEARMVECFRSRIQTEPDPVLRRKFEEWRDEALLRVTRLVHPAGLARPSRPAVRMREGWKIV